MQVLNINNLPPDYFTTVCKSTGDTLLHKLAKASKFGIQVYSKLLTKLQECFISQAEFVEYVNKENLKGLTA